MPTPANPYVAGPPISGETGFWGREDIFEDVERVLRYPPNNSVILYGPRRAGKTSLLRQLERRLPNPPFFTVYFDLAETAMLPLTTVLHQMAAAAAAKAGMPAPDLADFADNPAAFHEQFLPALYQKLGLRLQPIFLLDEFQPIDIPEDELPAASAIRNLDTYLYQLLSTQTHTDFIFAAGRRITELSDVEASTFTPSLRRFITPLTPDQTRALILQPGAPAFTPDALNRVIGLTRGQPYFTQLLCQALFNRVAARPTPEITDEDVKAALPELLAQPDSGLADLWHSIPPAERLTLAATAGRSTGPKDAITPAAINSAFNQTGIPLDTPGLAAAPQNLVNWQLFEQTGSGYTFFTEFLRRWVAQNQPLDQIKADELARLNGDAPRLYQAARQEYAAGHTKAALQLLKRATQLNPFLLAAFLLSGQIHTEAGQPDDARAAYEAAYQLSPVAAAGGLLAALISLGQRRAAAGDYSGAQAAYRRALEIAPGNPEAQSRLQSLPKAQPPEPRRRNWWPLAVAAALLLLLWCGWFYPAAFNPPQPPGTTAGQTTFTPTTAPPTIAVAAVTPTVPVAGDTPAPVTPNNLPLEPTATIATAAPADTATAIAVAVSPTAGFQQIRVAGSTEMQSMLQQAAAAFTADHPDVQITVDAGSAPDGLEAFRQGQTDLVVLTRNLTPAEKTALGNAQVVALPSKDSIAIIAQPQLPLKDLTPAQVRAIFSGQITNWAKLGGPAAPITLVIPEPNTDTRLAFEQQILGPDASMAKANAVVLPSDAAVRSAVAGTPDAIGFVLASGGSEPALLLTENWAVIDTARLQANTLTLNQAAPTAENAISGSYPLARPLNMVAPPAPNPAVQAWLDFLLGPQGRQIITKFGQNNQ